MVGTRTITLSLGSNISGNWGTTCATLARAEFHLQRLIGKVLHSSASFKTAPVGAVWQGDYTNKIMVLETNLASATVLRVLKRLERAAGRRVGTSVRWGPRPLDIDIIDHGGRITGRRPGMRIRDGRRHRKALPAQAPLILPHPQAHLRGFVLVPLLQVMPHWWHPVLGQPGRRLLNQLKSRHRVKPA
jgi:2-amino-4-hydroxy-6-hydroxymethyldihydropteridine diphosphokinase